MFNLLDLVGVILVFQGEELFEVFFNGLDSLITVYASLNLYVVHVTLDESLLNSELEGLIIHNE